MNVSSCFQDKLTALYSFVFSDVRAEKEDNEPVAAGCFEFLGDTLGFFYATFADHKEFLNGTYDIQWPDEAAIRNGIFRIAVERQNVCAYGVEVGTGRVIYQDDTNEIAEPIDMKLDDFILYLVALQCLGFCEPSGKIENASDLLKSRFDEKRITEHSIDGTVYAFDEGVLLVAIGKDAYVSAKDDESLAAFEADTSFAVDWF